MNGYSFGSKFFLSLIILVSAQVMVGAQAGALPTTRSASQAAATIGNFASKVPMPEALSKLGSFLFGSKKRIAAVTALIYLYSYIEWQELYPEGCLWDHKKEGIYGYFQNVLTIPGQLAYGTPFFSKDKRNNKSCREHLKLVIDSLIVGRVVRKPYIKFKPTDGTNLSGDIKWCTSSRATQAPIGLIGVPYSILKVAAGSLDNLVKLSSLLLNAYFLSQISTSAVDLKKVSEAING